MKRLLLAAVLVFFGAAVYAQTTVVEKDAFLWQRLDALSYDTVGPSPQAVTPPGSYALSIDGDFELGGFVFKDGAPFLHTESFNNLALGRRALESLAAAGYNTALGHYALRNTTSGQYNTAVGEALSRNETGRGNTAIGDQALSHQKYASYSTAVGKMAMQRASGFYNGGLWYASNTAVGAFALRGNATVGRNTGTYNTAVGESSLTSNTSGFRNTAVGRGALRNHTTGYTNIALGEEAGSVIETGNRNILIGHPGSSVAESQTIRIGDRTDQTRVFVAGIVPHVQDDPVCINLATDQLGLCGVSTRRLKREIENIGDVSARLMELRPVQFRFREELHGGHPGLRFGLISEEVAEVFPELVAYDEEGEPFSVRYHLLTPLLLNEVKKLDRRARLQGWLLGSVLALGIGFGVTRWRFT